MRLRRWTPVLRLLRAVAALLVVLQYNRVFCVAAVAKPAAVTCDCAAVPDANNSCTQVTSCAIGMLPPSLGSLRGLRSISLKSMSVQGSIPPSLGSIGPSLSSVILASNQLTSRLPSSLGSLAGLARLDLQSNKFITGALPPSLGSLANLTQLSLESMSLLSGPLPSSLGSLAALHRLTLWNTNVSGTLPSSFGSLRAATNVYLNNNANLGGSIPASLGSLTAATALVLSGNRLSGSVPATLANVTQLMFLSLSGNELAMPFPAWLGSLQHLTDLSLEDTGLTGSVPSSIGSLTALWSLALGGTDVEGTLPPSLASLTSLQGFSLTRQGLTGPLPQGLLWGDYWSSLRTLYLHGNQLTGEVAIGCAASLVAVELGGNDLTSIYLTDSTSTAPCFPGKLGTLSVPDNPHLAGTLPPSLTGYSSLYYFDVSNCSLTGPLPQLVSQNAFSTRVGHLVVLAADANQLTGSLPPGIGSLGGSLQYLNLAHNALDANVPASLCAMDFSRLTHCDLSNQSGPVSAGAAPDDCWECGDLLTSCAMQLVASCTGVGDRCLQTSHKFEYDTFTGLVAGVVSGVVVLAAVAGFVLHRRRTQKHLVDSRAAMRNDTKDLLQTFVPADEDVEDVILPHDSVDFGPHTPCVASGGGGSVYKCTLTLAASRRTAMCGQVALKEVHAMNDLVAKAAGVAEFAKELLALMKFHHEHIVTFYGIYQYFVQHDGVLLDRYFLVTQFADHGSLDAHVEAGFGSGPSLRRRLGWVREVALAVRYLHRENFVHRDIKPQNVLLHGEDWHCLLTDFGIARSLSADRAPTTALGTAQFMPPETLAGLSGASEDAYAGQPTTPAEMQLVKAWDTYSFGCLVACVFNRCVLPFPDLDERVVMVQVLLNDERPELPQVLGEELLALLQATWRKLPAERPDMTGVLAALDAAVAAEDAWDAGTGVGAFSAAGRRAVELAR